MVIVDKRVMANPLEKKKKKLFLFYPGVHRFFVWLPVLLVLSGSGVVLKHLYLFFTLALFEGRVTTKQECGTGKPHQSPHSLLCHTPFSSQGGG